MSESAHQQDLEKDVEMAGAAALNAKLAEVDDEDFDLFDFAPPYPFDDSGKKTVFDENVVSVVDVRALRDATAPDVDETEALSVDKMVRGCVQYLLLNLKRKVPVKREDIIKNVMNSRSKPFGEVMRQVDGILKNMLGMSLVKIKLDDNRQPCVANELDFGDKKILGFIFTSDFPDFPFEQHQHPEDGFKGAVYVNKNSMRFLN